MIIPKELDTIVKVANVTFLPSIVLLNMNCDELVGDVWHVIGPENGIHFVESTRLD